ncbi:hypothetical protein [Haloferula rosea]|uniref:Uncharacterized protein n=1 Tax=Haloferula rosea TaxID=490093 RepID=A0A934RAY0_9BACT|nr:hypothetical protein [Haloferula rosea]MBK1827185.1 hypothetical protein [Haloferula rosea]
MHFVRLLTILLVAATALPSLAGGKKQTMAGFAFHLETQPGENPKMVFPQFVAGKERVFRRVPEISTKDVEAFNPFPSQDGQGFGVLLKLKGGAANRLSGVTAANTGKWMIARVNGRIVDAVRIDQQITDGEMVIWKGLSQAEIAGMDKKLPRIGERKPRG